MTSDTKLFPYYASGTVVTGFQRGSTQIGMPTANYPDEVVDKLPTSFDQGVYFGWAQVKNGPVYKMVMSIGTNPYYNNEKKTMETHIMNKFEVSFYGDELRVIIVGYLRPMRSFEGLARLVDAIKRDVEQAKTLLDKNEFQIFKSDPYFGHTSIGLKSKV